MRAFEPNSGLLQKALLKAVREMPMKSVKSAESGFRFGILSLEREILKGKEMVRNNTFSLSEQV